MSALFQVHVYGIPVPQGSMKGFRVGNGVRLTSANPNMKPWRELVIGACSEIREMTLEGPLTVTLDFYLPKPKSTPKKVLWPEKKPDLDKLIRAVFDALTQAAIWRDDSLVVTVTASKNYATEAIPPGVNIIIGRKN